MPQIDTAAERILAPLSALLNKQLRIVESTSEVADAFSIHLPAGDLRLISSTAAFTENERTLIQEVFSLIRQMGDQGAKLAETQERLSFVERDNLDLIVKN